MNRHAIILSAALIMFARMAVAHPLDHWQLQTTNLSFNAVTYGNGLFVGVGMVGTNVTSPDGSAWAAHPLPTSGYLRAIAFGGSQFVGVGDSGLIMSSPDGTNWGVQVSGTSISLRRIAYGNGVFVAGGEFGAPRILLTSTDGTNWMPQSTPQPFDPSNIVFGKGLFVLESFGGTNLISTDGTNWFPRPSGSDTGLYTTGFGDGVFMSIDTRSRVFTSVDASNWVQRGSVTTIRPGQIAYGNGQFLIGGANRSEHSPNGNSWFTNPSLCCFYAQAYSFAFGNGFFVTCDRQGIKKSDPIVALQIGEGSSLRLVGPTGSVYAVESSTSLAPGEPWPVLTNFTLPTSPYLWTPPTSSNSTQRFYRARLVP